MDLSLFQARKHQANHRQIDKGFAAVGLSLVIAIESAIAAQPAKGSFDHPATWQHFERVQFGALDDLDGATHEPALLHSSSVPA